MGLFLILMNCHGDELRNYFEHIPEIKNNYTIKYICNYTNLENDGVFEDVEKCDILLTNNIKNYPLLTYENLKKRTKPDCKICKIEFIRFNGFCPFAYNGATNMLAVYDESTKSSNCDDYLKFSCDSERIVANFQKSLLELKELDNLSHIKFYDFFINNYKEKLLFRDNKHISHVMLKHIVKEILLFLDITTAICIDDLVLDYQHGFRFRIKPVLNCVKKVLGLTFDTTKVDMFNKIISIEEYYRYIQEAKRLNAFEDVQKLFFRKFGP